MRRVEAIKDRIRSHLSLRTRRVIAQRRVMTRSLTARWRCYPHFLIIGAQRSGTSSLYRYLGAHPDLLPSVRKETQYFSSRFGEGASWYRAHFPLKWRVTAQELITGRAPLSFEATPDYLFHPAAPRRVKESLPFAKFVVILRDPVDRAYSHYKHMTRLGMEHLEFSEALRVEMDRIADDMAILASNPHHRPRSALRYSYVSRGRYSEQLERWMKFFPRESFLILDFDEFLSKPEKTLRAVCTFLGVRSWTPRSFPNYSEHPQRTRTKNGDDELPDLLKERIRREYFPDIRKVNAVTGRTFSWL